MRESIRSILVASALVAGLAGCRTDKPEARVRAAFEACRTGLEAGDVAKALEGLAPTFKGPDDMDKPTAQLFLLATFRQEKVGITVLRNDVKVDGDEALQEVDLVLTSHAGSLLPQDASRRTFSLRWRKEGRDWRIVELQSLEGR